MLTPAEEEGLAGLALASRVQHALYRLAPAELAGLIERPPGRGAQPARRLPARRRGGADPDPPRPAHGAPRPARLRAPRHADRAERARAPAVALPPRLHRARDPPPARRRRSAGSGSAGARARRRTTRSFGRLDALVDFTSPMWKESLRFVEPNMSGIGGLHMVPTCERLLADVVVPVLRDGRRRARPDRGPGHARAADPGCCSSTWRRSAPARSVCFVEPKYAGNGPDEQEELARWLRDRYGLTVMHADPSELVLRGRRGVVRGPAGGPGLPRLRRGRPAGAGGRGRRRRADAGAAAGEPDDLVDRRRPRPEDLLGSADRSAALPAVLHARRSGSCSSATSSGPAC